MKLTPGFATLRRKVRRATERAMSREKATSPQRATSHPPVGLVSLALVMVVLSACGKASAPTVSVRGPASSSSPPARAVDTPLGRVTVGGITDLRTGSGPRRSARVVEVEACSSNGVPFSPASFLLRTADGRSWSPSPPAAAARRPDLATTVEPNPSPGSCARGWLTFDVDAAQRSTAILFHAPRSDETFSWSAR